MSLWNSFSYSFKEFHYLFFSVVVIFIFNILLEYNNFLNFKNQKHYLIDNALLTHQYIKYCKGYFKKEHVTILNNFSKNPK